MTKRCILCLQELDMFKGLDCDQFSKLCARTDKRHINKGEYLFMQGEHSNTVFLVKRGKFKLTKLSENGQEVIMDIVGPGEVMGDMSFYDEKEQRASAVAMEESDCCCLSRIEFERLVREDPEFSMRIITYLSKKLTSQQQRACEESHQNIKGKLLSLLYRFASEYGDELPNGDTIINLKITQQEIADMIGSSRVMVINMLKTLEQENIICRNQKYYVLKKDPCLAVHTFTHI